MKIFNTILFFLIIFGFEEIKAQTMFRPGFIITNNNDTVKGFVDYRGDTRNARRCDFKKSLDSETKEYSPTDIKSYRFADSKFYVSKKVEVNGTETQVFLEFLVDGIADLYYLLDESNSHYYIEKSDGKIFELNNEEITVDKDGKTYIAENKAYIGLLKIAFADCPQLFKQINQTKLDTKPLIEVTKNYHNFVCTDQKCVIYEKQIAPVKFTFAPIISMNGSFLVFHNSYFFEAMEFQISSYPSFGIQLNASLPRANEKISFQSSLEINKSNFYGKSGYTEYTYLNELNVKMLMLNGKAGIKYTYPKGKIRPTFLAGGSVMVPLTHESIRTESKITPTSQELRYTHYEKIMAGFYFGYNFELGLDCHVSPTMVPFLSFGYSRLYGSNPSDDVERFTTFTDTNLLTRLKTISIKAGIYF